MDLSTLYQMLALIIYLWIGIVTTFATKNGHPILILLWPLFLLAGSAVLIGDKIRNAFE